jgi:hypothetical protein
MNHFRVPLSLSEARRHITMNLSILEMLKGNTDPGDISRLRQLWVAPYEDLIRDLEAPDSPAALKDPHDP